jgi:hypothetical protein
VATRGFVTSEKLFSEGRPLAPHARAPIEVRSKEEPGGLHEQQLSLRKGQAHADFDDQVCDGIGAGVGGIGVGVGVGVGTGDGFGVGDGGPGGYCIGASAFATPAPGDDSFVAAMAKAGNAMARPRMAAAQETRFMGVLLLR